MPEENKNYGISGNQEPGARGNTGTGNSGKVVPVGREPEAGKSDPGAKHQKSIGEEEGTEASDMEKTEAGEE
jgi:hypothetical protein